MATKNVVQPQVIKWLIDHKSISYNSICTEYNSYNPEKKIRPAVICNNIKLKFNLPKFYEPILEKALEKYGYTPSESGDAE